MLQIFGCTVSTAANQLKTAQGTTEAAAAVPVLIAAPKKIAKQNRSYSFIFFNKYYRTFFQDLLLRTRLIAIKVGVCPVAFEFWFCVGDGAITVEVSPVASEFWFNVGDGAITVRVSPVASEFCYCSSSSSSARHALASDRGTIHDDLI